MGHKIAYLMSRFPHLPETFILREMIEIEKLGWEVALYPLIHQRQAVVHPEAQAWIPRIRKLPFVSGGVVQANLAQLAQHPITYSGLWGQAIRENWASPNLLVRALALFPKAVYAARLMRQEGVAHIHAHYATHPALVAWLIHRITGLSYSVTVHAHDIFVRTAMLGTKMRSAAFVAAISQYNRDHLARLLGEWVRPKVHIVHCGVDTTKYAPRNYVAHQAMPQSDVFEILSIGSLQPYKGHPYLIRACALLRDQGLPFRCRIVGGGEDRPQLERLIAELNLSEQVILMGGQPQAEVARLLTTVDCYVQPSIITATGKMEGIPVALMEALACELPVVATELSGVPELVRPGATGWLVPPANAEALAQAIAQVRQNPAAARQYAQAGRALVLQEFNLQDNVAQLGRLFTQVTGHTPTASR